MINEYTVEIVVRWFSSQEYTTMCYSVTSMTAHNALVMARKELANQHPDDCALFTAEVKLHGDNGKLTTVLEKKYYDQQA